MTTSKEFFEEYIEINGIWQYFLHCPSSPDDSVVIHLHGGPGSSAANFAYTLAPYRDFCNVVYYDQRGAGRTQAKSKSKPEDITLENLLADLKATIRYVKERYATDRIVLLGQSWGTALGTQYILRYPDDVACYIGTGHCIDSRREMKASYGELKSRIENNGSKRDIRKLESLGDYINISLDDKDYVKKEIEFFALKTKYGMALKTLKLLNLMRKSPVFKWGDVILAIQGTKTNVGLMKTLLDYSIWDTAEYAIPVYYILGRDDWQTPSTVAAEYFERINVPKKKLYWIENVGHATDVDSPAEFCQAVKEILELEALSAGS